MTDILSIKLHPTYKVLEKHCKIPVIQKEPSFEPFFISPGKLFSYLLLYKAIF